MLIRDYIKELILESINSCHKNGILPIFEIDQIEVERPQNTDNGDFAVSLPLKLTKVLKSNPLEIANTLTTYIDNEKANIVFDKILVAPPGFINFYLSQNWVQKQLEEILKSGKDYGNITKINPKKIQIEFVSVNPTGPLHVGHARGAVLGSSLASIIQASGDIVSKEYYINDAGNQIDLFVQSVYSKYSTLIGHEYPMPENGYMGDYIEDIAQEIHDENNSRKLNEKEIKPIALDKMLSNIRLDLLHLNVEFDNWFSEKSLFTSGEFDDTMNQFEKDQHSFSENNAIWFKATDFGEEKDHVLIRTNLEPTYYATDIAYHRNKFLIRKYDTVIDIWGADHHGHISRLKSALEAIGVDRSKLNILLYQLVSLKQGDDKVRASKRAGTIITTNELVEEVGSDACRYFFISRSPDSHMDFDIDLAQKKSSDNPVFYIQYAHARAFSILKSAADEGIKSNKGKIALLGNEHEINLLKKFTELSEIIQISADRYEPHHLAKYSLELATLFHLFYQNCRVIDENQSNEISSTRLKLVDGFITVIGKCLDLMGMSKPESM
ncbi:MAG: arginine--tRNA ligase [SAR202 cluster bacterium]|nr:arginine--tRNA ligase [SAR202 cluster bacterium]